MEKQMMVIDLEKMVSYPLDVINQNKNLQRTAFGLVQLQEKDFLIFGGYNEYGGEIEEINPYYMIFQIKFSLKRIIKQRVGFLKF